MCVYMRMCLPIMYLSVRMSGDHVVMLRCVFRTKFSFVAWKGDGRGAGSASRMGRDAGPGRWLGLEYFPLSSLCLLSTERSFNRSITTHHSLQEK